MGKRSKRVGLYVVGPSNPDLVVSGKPAKAWAYRDPKYPMRNARIENGQFWDSDRREWRSGFQVWVQTKKPKLHYIFGDIMDACALAQILIENPKWMPPA